MKPQWEDAPDEWSSEIDAAHPIITGRHDLYATASLMVGNRHSKGALIELVNWLLVRLESQGGSMVFKTPGCPTPSEGGLPALDQTISAYLDAVVGGTGVLKGGVRVDPIELYKEPEDQHANLARASTRELPRASVRFERSMVDGGIVTGKFIVYMDGKQFLQTDPVLMAPGDVIALDGVDLRFARPFDFAER